MHKTYMLLVMFFLVLLPLKNRVEACCAMSFERSFDTLATSPDLIVKRATWMLADTVFDTIYRSEMLQELRDKYSASSHVFLATADTAFFYSDSNNYSVSSTGNEPVIIRSSFFVDSVIILIDTIFKSKSADFQNGYRFPVVTRYYAMTSIDPVSLSSLRGRKLLGFSNDISSLLTMLPAPRACAYPEGFYVDANDMIIHDKYDGISIPLTTFLENVAPTSIQKPAPVKKSMSVNVRSLFDGSLAITLPMQRKMSDIQVSTYSFTGAIINKSTIPILDNTAILSFDKLSKGIYLIVISGSDSKGNLFRTSVSHSVLGK
jgi:hypothetical protein